MAFSQELKIEAHTRGFRCLEMPIQYFPRGGESKNRTLRDGFGNLAQLVGARMRGNEANTSALVASPPRPVMPLAAVASPGVSPAG